MPADSAPGPTRTVVLRQIPTALYWRAAAHTDALTRELALLANSSDARPVPKQLTSLMVQLMERFGSYDEQARLEITRATERGDAEVTVEYTMPTSFLELGPRLIELWDEADAFCREGVELLTLATPPDTNAFRRWVVGQFTRQLSGEAPLSWPEYAAVHLDAAPDATESESVDLTVSRQVSEDGIPVLVLSGQIDLDTAPEVRTALQQVRDAGANTIVVDMAGVEFLDSVGISVLIAARQRLVDDGGGLVVRSPSRPVRRTLEVAGLRELFQMGG